MYKKYISRCDQLHLATSTQTQSAAQFGTCACVLGSHELVTIPCVSVGTPPIAQAPDLLVGPKYDMFMSLVIRADPRVVKSASGCSLEDRQSTPLAVAGGRWQVAGKIIPKDLNPGRRRRFCIRTCASNWNGGGREDYSSSASRPVKYGLAKSFVDNCASPFPALRRISIPAETPLCGSSPSEWASPRDGSNPPRRE